MAMRCGGAGFSLEGEAGMEEGENGAKRRRTEGPKEVTVPGGTGMFEELPDELVLSILADVAATANSPAHLAAAMLTCKRFRELGQHRLVLARASPCCIAVRANSWSDDAHRFLHRCSCAGNLDASYLLGMIRYYCLGSRRSGSELMGMAALRGHAEALYSLAIIQFNGSGRSKDDRNLRAGAQLCASAAARGHTDALRELGHCVSDGYGVRRSVSDGRRLLIQANFREMRDAFTGSALDGALGHHGGGKPHMCLLSDFGCHMAAAAGRRAHAANAFLVEWFASRPVVGEADGHALRLCSQPACGRPETRQHEFRRCSVCGVVVYCSRACQALHWKAAHKNECTPIEQWLVAAHANANVNANAAAPNVNAAAANANANANADVAAPNADANANANANANAVAAAPVAGGGGADATTDIYMAMP